MPLFEQHMFGYLCSAMHDLLNIQTNNYDTTPIHYNHRIIVDIFVIEKNMYICDRKPTKVLECNLICYVFRVMYSHRLFYFRKLKLSAALDSDLQALMTFCSISFAKEGLVLYLKHLQKNQLVYTL